MTILDRLAATDSPHWRDEIDLRRTTADDTPAERIVDGHPKDAPATGRPSPTE
jgi:hypothetical protein